MMGESPTNKDNWVVSCFLDNWAVVYRLKWPFVMMESQPQIFFIFPIILTYYTSLYLSIFMRFGKIFVYYYAILTEKCNRTTNFFLVK